ncbi:hypothetical protein [Micromonospora sp. CPCC 206061]
MPSIQPIVSTPDLKRLRAFYEKVLDADGNMLNLTKWIGPST